MECGFGKPLYAPRSIAERIQACFLPDVCAFFLRQVLTVPSGRYRLAMLPAIFFFAACAFARFRWRRCWPVLPVLLAVSLLLQGHDTGRAEADALLGEAAFRQGKLAEAKRLLTRAAREIDDIPRFGNLLGGGWAILNFFIMGLAVQKSVKKELPEEAKLVLQNSYTKRLLAMVAILLIGFKVEYFNWVAVVIPMFFPRITIGLMKLPIFHRKEEE